MAETKLTSETLRNKIIQLIDNRISYFLDKNNNGIMDWDDSINDITTFAEYHE